MKIRFLPAGSTGDKDKDRTIVKRCWDILPSGTEPAAQLAWGREFDIDDEYGVGVVMRRLERDIERQPDTGMAPWIYLDHEVAYTHQPMQEQAEAFALFGNLCRAKYPHGPHGSYNMPWLTRNSRLVDREKGTFVLGSMRSMELNPSTYWKSLGWRNIGEVITLGDTLGLSVVPYVSGLNHTTKAAEPLPPPIVNDLHGQLEDQGITEVILWTDIRYEHVVDGVELIAKAFGD